jgi:uncharacterized LabA/DUF88 family protein
MPSQTAVLIDGGFFVKRMRRINPDKGFDAEFIADQAHKFAMAHLVNKQSKLSDDLYRIFFYDCAPLQKKMHNPISNKAIDFSKSNEALFRLSLHQELMTKRKVALRLGKLSPDVQWNFKPQIAQSLMKGKITLDKLTENDVIPSFRQKGVDMRIAIDIASITLKTQANRIILMAGDSDFVPAAKLARREGIDFILDPMWHTIPSDLFEHIDGLRSVCPKPPAREQLKTDSVPQ